MCASAHHKCAVTRFALSRCREVARLSYGGIVTKPGDDAVEVGVLRTRRLALVPMSCVLMKAVMAQDWISAGTILGAPFPAEWHADGWEWLAPRLMDGELTPSSLAWGTRTAHLESANVCERGPVIAEAGFHGPPDAEGWVEIGYRVVAAHRREGFAEEAAVALIAWATQHGVNGIRGSVNPENVASSNLLRKLGFVETGSYQHRTLGEQLRFSLSTEHQL